MIVNRICELISTSLCYMLILSCTHLGCGSQPSHLITLNVTQHVGGRIIAACIDQDQIFLRKHFALTSLKYRSGRLLRLERSLPPQLRHAPSSESQSADSTRSLKRRLESLLRSFNSTPTCLDHKAWVQLGERSSLKTKWRGALLHISPREWRWGNESRKQLTGLKEMTPLTLPRRSSLGFQKTATRAEALRYLIVSETGLWVWRHGSQPRYETLPTRISPPLLNISRDGGVWWISTPHHHGRRVWPLQLFNGPAKLVGEPYLSRVINDQLLVPLGGRALRARRNDLKVTWGIHRLSTPPVKSLCSLSPNIAVVATSKDVRILYNAQATPETYEPSKRWQTEVPSTQSEYTALVEAYHFLLPSATDQVVCEGSWLTLLGSDYGLLRLKVDRTRIE